MNVGKGLGLAVVDHVDPRAIVPLDVNTPALIPAAKVGDADGISGGVVTTEGELVAVHVACSGFRVAM